MNRIFLTHCMQKFICLKRKRESIFPNFLFEPIKIEERNRSFKFRKKSISYKSTRSVKMQYLILNLNREQQSIDNSNPPHFSLKYVLVRLFVIPKYILKTKCQCYKIYKKCKSPNSLLLCEREIFKNKRMF